VTTLIHALRQGSPLPRLHLDPVRRRGTAVAVLLAAALALPGALEASLDALADAYLAVSVFVAGTLALLLAAERTPKPAPRAASSAPGSRSPYPASSSAWPARSRSTSMPSCRDAPRTGSGSPVRCSRWACGSRAATNR
jgi:hypothetical protein